LISSFTYDFVVFDFGMRMVASSPLNFVAGRKKMM